jgi:hypothetical protein
LGKAWGCMPKSSFILELNFLSHCGFLSTQQILN